MYRSLIPGVSYPLTILIVFKFKRNSRQVSPFALEISVSLIAGTFEHREVQIW